MAVVITQVGEELELELLDRCSLCESAFSTVDDETHLCKCEVCGYVFDNPRPTVSAIVGFYSRPMQYDSWIKARNAREKLWQRRLAKFLPFAKPGSLLDVGTGIGQFLEHAKPYFQKVVGTEVSESAVRIGRERYQLNIVRGEIQDVSLSDAPFDNVTLFHVLEHVPYPKDTLRHCQGLLKANGILVICVPNEVLAWTSKIKALGRNLGIDAFRKFSGRYGISRAGTSREIHLSRFTPSVLRRLVNHCGFEVIQESLDPYYVASGLGALLHTAYYGFNRFLFGLFGINRYDTIWMIARKHE